MFYIVRSKLHLLSIFFFVFVVVRQIYPYRIQSYGSVFSGARSTALGGTSLSELSSDGASFIPYVFQNPALLGTLKKRYLVCDITSQVRYRTLRFDYQLDFNTLNALGFFFPLKYELIPYIGLIYQTVFRIPSYHDVTRPLTMRLVGIGTAFSMNKTFSIGMRTGLLMAFEAQDVAVAPSLLLSYQWVCNDFFMIGGSILLPHHLDWSPEKNPLGSRDIQEVTPTVIRFGGLFKVTRQWRLRLEASYHAWNWTRYKDHEDISSLIHTNKNLLKILQDVSVHTGIHFRGKVNVRNKLLFEGDACIGFYPEVLWLTVNEDPLMTGNLTMGFSFKPFHIQSLRLHLSVVDQVFLGLLKIFPHNTLQDVFYLTSEFCF